MSFDDLAEEDEEIGQVRVFGRSLSRKRFGEKSLRVPRSVAVRFASAYLEGRF
jgi:hypothetical protein